MARNREAIKALIELSTTVEEANEVIEETAGLKTLKEKVAFLEGMFDVEIIDRKRSDSLELVYNLYLNAIISKKWM